MVNAPLASSVALALIVVCKPSTVVDVVPLSETVIPLMVTAEVLITIELLPTLRVID